MSEITEISFPVEPIIIEIPPEGQDGRSATPRGVWDEEAEYIALDIVFYEGSSYMATGTVPVGTLPTDSEYWMLSAEQGEQGEQGDQGDPGQAATIAVGTVTTLPAGSSATVENSGTSSAAVFDFGIPQGEKGDPGVNTWGSITGDLADQTDLQAVLDEKENAIRVTATDAVVSITDAAGYPAEILSVAVEPIQDLHGQPYPYQPGQGKNIALVDADHVTSQQNCTYSFKNNGFEAVSTANYGRVGFTWPVTEGETYTISYTASRVDGSSQYPRLIYSTEDATWSTTGTGYLSHQTFTTTPTRYSYTFTATSSGIVFIGAYLGTTTFPNDITVTDFMIEKGSTATAFAPYSNICPISGHSGGNLYHEDEYDAGADPKVTYAFGQTVYGAGLNALTGVLTVDRGYIDSYNGETLPGAWISDRDAYVPGTVPTVGAQVVYELAEPFTVDLTGYEGDLAFGANAVWTDCGDTTLKYRADLKLYIDGKIAAAVANLQALILENN